MKVLIVGAEGSMGKRYQAIFNHLGVSTICVDKHTPSKEILEGAEKSQGIVLATPTDLHTNCLDVLSKFQLPILCEKPLTKDLEELKFIRDEIVKKRKINLTMTMQYEMLTQAGARGVSWYNYFRHGSDGLGWDCLQIIGLAKSSFVLEEKSPIWKCGINGQTLSLSDMDLAYLLFVQRWLSQPGDDISRLFDIHLKVMEFNDGQGH